jgi:hypothetical protein
MGANQTEIRLNNAVQLCLQRCYLAYDPIATLAQYADNLRALGWDDVEVAELEVVVRRILRRVKLPAENDKMPKCRSLAEHRTN